VLRCSGVLTLLNLGFDLLAARVASSACSRGRRRCRQAITEVEAIVDALGPRIVEWLPRASR
jgi:hypothetical protein